MEAEVSNKFGVATKPGHKSRIPNSTFTPAQGSLIIKCKITGAAFVFEPSVLIGKTFVNQNQIPVWQIHNLNVAKKRSWEIAKIDHVHTMNSKSWGSPMILSKNAMCQIIDFKYEHGVLKMFVLANKTNGTGTKSSRACFMFSEPKELFSILDFHKFPMTNQLHNVMNVMNIIYCSNTNRLKIEITSTNTRTQNIKAQFTPIEHSKHSNPVSVTVATAMEIEIDLSNACFVKI